MTIDTIIDTLKNNSALLISYKGTSISRDDFYNDVIKIEEILTKTNTSLIKEFIALHCENPLHLYPLIFACWRQGLKIYFPNKDFLEGTCIFENCKYTLRYDGSDIKSELNTSYMETAYDERGDTVLFSSGSTGKPKGILHHHSHFFKNAQSMINEIGLSGYVSITMLKPYLVSALSHFLVHLSTESHLIFTDIEDKIEIEKYSQLYKNLAIVGSPVHLLMTLNYLATDAKPIYFFSSGDLIYPSVIEKIIKTFPSTLFFHVYGLAELAGRFFINKYDRNTEKNEYLKIGKNIGGTTCTVQEDQLYVDSDFLFFGYIINNQFIPSSRPHPTGDKVIVDNGFIIEGRMDDEIKIGGNKISLKNIERKISDILKESIVIIVPFKQEPFGTLIALCIQSNDTLTKRFLLENLRKVLRPYEIPHKYYQITTIEYTQTFKIDRKKIAQNLSTYEEIK